jgi:hypothetical protein
MRKNVKIQHLIFCIFRAFLLHASLIYSYSTKLSFFLMCRPVTVAISRELQYYKDKHHILF